MTPEFDSQIDLISWLSSRERLGKRDRLVLGVANGPHRDRLTRMLADPRMQEPLRILFEASPKSGVGHDEAIVAVLQAAATPSEYFIDTTDWKQTNREHARAQQAARKARGELAKADWSLLQAKADHETEFSRTGRTFEISRLTQALDEYLRLFEWACALPPPPQGDLVSRKKRTARDRAILKCRLLKREAQPYFESLPYQTIADLATVSEDLADDDVLTRDNARKA